MAHGIRQWDHPLRFIVPSETRPAVEHYVDLFSYRRNGRCTCEHFTNRCEPKLRRGALPGPLWRCNHIEKARDYFIGLMLEKIGEHMPEQEEGE